MFSMTTTPTNTQPLDGLIVGVDTHQQTHHAVIIDPLGRRIADRGFPASHRGYADLIGWAADHDGPIAVFGIESTGSYGAGLTRAVLVAGHRVIEVNRPSPTVRVTRGKSDPIDAEAAARAVLAGEATAQPKVSTGITEAIRALKISRDSAVKARTAAISQLRDLATTAPDPLRDTLLGLTTKARIKAAARLRPDLTQLADPTHATRYSLKTLARRIHELDTEITNTDKLLHELVAATVPTLIAQPQIGTQTAATLLLTAGENLDRFTTEAQYAKLTGVAPLPASSGKTQRMRLNRGGDRQANRALHLIAVGRMKSHPPTRAYITRREHEQLTTKDIIRCLKRAIAREVFKALRTDLLTS